MIRSKSHGIRSRLLTKFMLGYSLVMAVTVTVTASLITRHVFGRLEREELSRQTAAISKTKEFAARIFTRIRNVVIQFHYSDDGSDSSATELAKWLEVDRPRRTPIPTGATATLNGVVLSEDYVLDVVFIDNRGRSLAHLTSRQARDLVPFYDFTTYADERLPDDIVGGVRVFSEETPPYLLRSSTPVVTFLGAILDPRAFPDRRRIGTLLINVSADLFLRTLVELGAAESGILTITASDGSIIFSSQPDPPTMNLQANASDYVIHRSSLDQFGLTFTHAIRRDHLFRGIIETRNRMIATFSGSALVLLLATAGFSAIMGRRVSGMTRAMSLVESGDLTARMTPGPDDELGYLADSFNRMCERLSGFIDREYRYRLNVQHAELAAIQERINPHFLYNTLEIIRMKAERSGNLELSEVIGRLGRYFRWMVRSVDAETTLAEELEQLSVYVSIYQLSAPAAFELLIDVPRRLRDARIPKLILQPIVENSLVHAFAAARTRPGHITVSAGSSAGRIWISVCDDGVGMTSERLNAVTNRIDGACARSRRENGSLDAVDSTAPVGLASVAERLSLLHGTAAGLTVLAERGRGTTSTIWLPAPPGLTADEGRHA